MDIEEMKVKRAEIERAFSQMLGSFCAVSSADVSGVSFRRSQSGSRKKGESRFHYHIHISVEV